MNDLLLLETRLHELRFKKNILCGFSKTQTGKKMTSVYQQEMQKHFRSHSKIRDYGVHTSKVHSVGWNCEGKRLASGSFDKSACTFTLERDRLVISPTHHFVCCN